MAIDPATAFVSYSRDDWEFVLRLAKDLKAKGAKVWMDKLDLRPGQTWADEIEAAVNSCSKMLIVLSPASVASRNVQAEVGYAISEGKEIIPIFYRQCNIPFRLLPYQYADFRTDYAAGLQELASSLNNETTSVTPPPSADEEERRRQSVVFRAHLEERHGQASVEQAQLDLDQHKQPEASEQAGIETVYYDAAEQALAQQAAEEKAKRRKRMREEIFGQPPPPKEPPKPTFAAIAARRLLEQAREIRTQSARLRGHVVNGLADWQQRLRYSLPTPSGITSKAPRGVIVAVALSAVVTLGTVAFESVAILLREIPSPPAAAPPTGPALTATPQSKTGKTEPQSRPEPSVKPNERATTSSAAGALSIPISLPRNAATVVPPISASLPLAPVIAPPAGMSTRLVEVYRRTRRGDANAMQELANAFHKGIEVPRDDEQAVLWYRKAAEAGNVLAMNKLGDMYKDGAGLKQDYPQALYWYRKAAEAGNARGMSNLGKMYDNGWGVPTNYAQAADWYRKAAAAGDIQGVLSLGVMYEDGSGVSKDLQQAIACYRKAADAGDATGMFYLADMYEYGKGVKKDFSQAFYWYRRAAEAGDSGGMNKTAAMYEKGLGVDKDQAQAVLWYRRAAESGDQSARANLKRLGVVQ